MEHRGRLFMSLYCRTWRCGRDGRSLARSWQEGAIANTVLLGRLWMCLDMCKQALCRQNSLAASTGQTKGHSSASAVFSLLARLRHQVK
eukprot:5988073-Amphidinium_carterae.1